MFLKFQNKILERIARGNPLTETMDLLCLEAQALAPDVLCSVLLVDSKSCLRPLSAPSLPEFYTEALDGVRIGPDVGSCGTAAFLRAEVTVTDVLSDPLWMEFRSLASLVGLRACWSTPICDGSGRVLGTFAFYYTQPRGPGEIERNIVSACVHLCAIAIEREERVLERQRLAFTDDLTGLGNRAAFNRRIEKAGAAGRWSLLLLDLDNLKTVNDNFGHDAGDELLQIVARKMALVSPKDSGFRLGGDEFAVVLPSGDPEYDMAKIAAKLLLSLKSASVGAIVPQASIGGAYFDGAQSDPRAVRRNADVALYHAKETGGGRFVLFDDSLPSANTRVLGRREGNLADLQKAAGLLCRPIIDVCDERVEGQSPRYAPTGTFAQQAVQSARQPRSMALPYVDAKAVTLVSSSDVSSNNQAHIFGAEGILSEADRVDELAASHDATGSSDCSIAGRFPDHKERE